MSEIPGEVREQMVRFQEAADALGRIRSLDELTAVLAKMAHRVPEHVIEAVREVKGDA